MREQQKTRFGYDKIMTKILRDTVRLGYYVEELFEA